MKTKTEGFPLFFINSKVVDNAKILPDNHKLTLISLLKYEKAYPSAIARWIQEEYREDISIPAMIKTLHSLEEKELIQKVDMEDILKPGNISSYYKLTPSGLLLTTLWAKENGISEEKIRDSIRKGFEEFGYSKNIIKSILTLRDKTTHIS